MEELKGMGRRTLSKTKEKNKKGFRKFVVSLMLMTQLVTLATPLTAYADNDDDDDTEEVESEDEDEENKEGTFRKGNVYADGNPRAVQAYEDAASYDPYVHYITTFNILKSGLNDAPKGSPYAMIYRGDEGNALKGSGSVIEDTYEKRDTKSTSLVEEVEELTSGDESAGDALGESPSTEDEDDVKLTEEELIEKGADELTKALMPLIDKHLALNVSKSDIETKGGNHGYPTENSFLGNIGIDKDGLGSGYIMYGGLKKAVESSGKEALNVGSEGYKLFSRYFKEELIDYLNSNTGLSRKTSEDEALSIIDGLITKAGDRYDKKLGTSDKSSPGIFADGSGHRTYNFDSGVGTWSRKSSKPKSYNKEDMEHISNKGQLGEYKISDTVYLIRTKGYDQNYTFWVSKRKQREAGEEAVETDGIAFVRTRYGYNLDHMPEVYTKGRVKEIGRRITQELRNPASSLYKLESHINNNKLDTDDGIKVVAWTPIYPKVTDVDDGKFKDQLQEAHKEAEYTGGSMKLGGEDRPLMGMDLFLSTRKKDYSPVLIGTDKGQQEVVSRLRVGDPEGSLTSGNTHTAKLVGHKLSGIVGDFEEVDVEDMEDVIEGTAGNYGKGNYLTRWYSRYAGEYGGNFGSKTVGQARTLGVDNYGNVINGEDGTVIIPYWHNHIFSETTLKQKFFPFSPAIRTYGDKYEGLDDSLLASEGVASKEDIKSFVGGDNPLYSDALKVLEMVEGDQSIINSMDLLENGYGTLNEDATLRGLAVIIAASTEDDIKDWNERMLEDAKFGSELYVSFDELMLDRSNQELVEKRRWTAASLIQKIGWIMDYGFADTLRLTVVSNLTRTYNSTIAQAGLEYVFYTEDITNSDGWQSMLVLISTILGAIIMIYLLWVGMQAYRGEVSWSKVLTKTLILAGILVYPMLGYGNMVKYMINKPTEWMMGNQMRLSVVLDTYFAEEGTNRNTNEFYENMFGKYADSDSLQLGSYNIVFYTTMDKDGFDINKTSPQDDRLSFVQSAVLENYQKGKTEYPKDKLVSVHVPLIDLYKWVWDVRYSGKGMDDDTYGRNSGMPTYSEAMAVMGDGDNSLFQWLAKGGSSFFGVTDYEPELASYEEYRVVTDAVKPDESKNMDVEEDLSTYGATYQSHVEGLANDDPVRYNSTYTEVATGTGTHSISGSELFYDIVYNSSTEASDDDINANLGALEDLSKLASLPEMEDSSKYIPTDDDLRSLIRDLSTTNRGRRYWYGENKQWSNFTKSVLVGEGNGVIIDSDGNSLDLVHKPELTPPKEDFLGLTHIVEMYTQETRDERNPYSRNSLEYDVSRINKNLLENYLSTYSITKMSLGDDDDRDPHALNHAERMVMSTEAYFQFNKAMGWRHFPRAYAVDSIKFDKYMALMYIPFRDYGKETMTFFDDSTVVPMSTAEYIAMEDSVFAYFLFMVAIVLLILFGLFYLGVLYVGLLAYSMYNFIKYYLIQHDMKNKSALGSMFIIGTMSISKLIVMGVVWLTSWFMNRGVATSSTNSRTYPTTSIHSLIMIATLLIVFFTILRPMWRGVMGDKDNMGGQFFSDKVQDINAKLSSGVGSIIGGGGGGVRGGSQASKFNTGRGSGTNRKDRGNASRLGNMSKAGLRGAKKLAGNLTGGKVGFGTGAGIGAGTKRNIDRVQRALSTRSDAAKGINRAGRKAIDPSKFHAGNLIERRQVTSLADGLNNIAQTTSGLAEVAVAGAKVGTELANFKSGAMTTMAVGSASAAGVIASNLMKQGIQAKVDGSNVVFDSSGYDLESKEARSELFHNTITDLNEEGLSKRAEVVGGKVDGSIASNYDYSRGDKRINLSLDEAHGIHPRVFQELSSTKEFKDLFITPREEELKYDRNGNVIGLPTGGLRVTNPQLSASEVQGKMNALYEKDAQLRKDNGIYDRKQRDRGAFSIKGMDENYFNENIAPDIKGHKGIHMQGSRVVYNKMNPEHVNAVRKIKSKVNDYNEQMEEDYGQVSNNLTRYVAMEGDNQGLKTTHTNAEDDKGTASMLYGGNYRPQNVRKYKVNDQEIGEVSDNIEAVNRLRQQSKSSDKKLQKTTKDFTSSKRALRHALSNEVESLSGENRRVFNQEMVDYLQGTEVAQMREFKDVQNNMHKFKRQYDENEISKEAYESYIRKEGKNLEKIMDGTGKLDGFILGRYNSRNPHIKEVEERFKGQVESEGKSVEGFSLKDMYNKSADALDESVGRKKLMEMPLHVVEATTREGGEEYHLDGKGVLVQRSDARRRHNTIEGKDKDSVMNYLMRKSMDLNPTDEKRSRRTDNA